MKRELLGIEKSRLTQNVSDALNWKLDLFKIAKNLISEQIGTTKSKVSILSEKNQLNELKIKLSHILNINMY